MVRVAVLQIERSSPDEDLASCLRQIDRAVNDHGALVLVCPELRLEADESQGGAPSAVSRLREQLAERARTHRVWIGLSLRGPGVSLRTWLDPEGVASHEAAASGPIMVTTPHGTFGLCCGEAVLESAVARELAIAGASLVCAPLSLCPAAAAALQVPARAVENGIYLAVAAMFEPAPARYEGSLPTLPPEPSEAASSVRGAASQIVGPNGKPLAIAVLDETGIAVADLELEARGSLADGTRLVELRRPELYRTSGRSYGRRDPSCGPPLRVAALDVPYRGDLRETLASAVADIAALAGDGVSLVVLPELFCFDSVSDDSADAAADEFAPVVRALAEGCRGSGAHVVTSLVERAGEDLTHVGLVIGQAGIVARQQQLHLARRSSWARAGRRVELVRLPWGNLTIAVGEDALLPELLRTFARLGADLIAAPLSGKEHALAGLTLPALAAELRLHVVAALRADQEPDEGRAATSFIVDPSCWPASRALPGERILEGRLSLRALAALGEGGSPAERTERFSLQTSA